MRTVFFLVAWLAAPAAAQVATVTECSTLGYNVTCRSQPDQMQLMYQRLLNPPAPTGPSIMDVINARKAEKAEKQAELADMQERYAEQARQEKAADLRRRAGQMVAAGNCTGARTLVLNEGDFEAAKAVDGVCASGWKPTAPAP